jgi:glycine/D-amino acid oxidase-like deaminating enzyme
LTTLAIIGGGIAGRSLLYALSSQNSPFEKILLFESSDFASPCALTSTAIVAPRGVTRGHSPLGDLIIEGVEEFRSHVKNDSPEGVYPIAQYTGAITKLEQFKQRYPGGKVTSMLDQIPLKKELYFAQEDALMIDPSLYLKWLLQKAQHKLPIEIIPEFVTALEADHSQILTHSGKVFEADHIVFATGAMSRFWKKLAPESRVSSSSAVQGSYLEFNNIHFDLPSFSLTLEGSNLIYRSHSKILLIGSTTESDTHLLASSRKLKVIYDFLSETIDLSLPEFTQGKVLTGHREKAQKREPYLFTEGRISFMGGFYKNGFSLSLKQSRKLAHQLLALD